MSYAACLNLRKLSEATCPKQVALGLKQRGPISGPSGAIRILGTQITDRNLDLKWSQNTDVWSERNAILPDTGKPVCFLSVCDNIETSQIVLTTLKHNILSNTILEESGLVRKPQLKYIWCVILVIPSCQSLNILALAAGKRASFLVWMEFE